MIPTRNNEQIRAEVVQICNEPTSINAFSVPPFERAAVCVQPHELISREWCLIVRRKETHKKLNLAPPKFSQARIHVAGKVRPKESNPRHTRPHTVIDRELSRKHSEGV
jgi:hypothetical protein